MASLFCPVCGTENPATRQFCRKCAADLHALAPNPNAPSAEPSAVPARAILLGAIAALVVVALVVAVFVLGGSPAASPAPSSTPAVTGAPSAAATQPATAAPIETAPAETAAPQETSAGTVGPTASGTPVVDTLKGPGSASCTTTNGTALPGYVKLSWTASNTSGVRLSIDPPAPNNAYDYGFEDYAATDSAEVPFTCDPPNTDAKGAYHLYVVTTAHEKGYFAYRFIKVYLKP